jgi:hypothetical protein
MLFSWSIFRGDQIGFRKGLRVGPPIKDCLDDARRKQGQPQDSADQVALLTRPGQIPQRRMLAGVQNSPPSERQRYRLDRGVVDPRPRRP